MKLNLKSLLVSAAVLTFLLVMNPLCSFAQESELVSRPYLEKSSNTEAIDESLESGSNDDESLKNANNYYGKDSIVSSASRSNQVASHRNQRAKNSNEAAKQTENQKQVDKNEEKDSILSFNFIYYIFKKFKWSDIAD